MLSIYGFRILKSAFCDHNTVKNSTIAMHVTGWKCCYNFLDFTTPWLRLGLSNVSIREVTPISPFNPSQSFFHTLPVAAACTILRWNLFENHAHSERWLCFEWFVHMQFLTFQKQLKIFIVAAFPCWPLQFVNWLRCHRLSYCYISRMTHAYTWRHAISLNFVLKCLTNQGCDHLDHSSFSRRLLTINRKSTNVPQLSLVSKVSSALFPPHQQPCQPSRCCSRRQSSLPPGVSVCEAC